MIKVYLLIITIILISFTSCTNPPEKPQLNLTSTVNGLEINLTGNAFDADGALTKVIIDWNDNSSLRIINDGFDKINESHKYKTEGDYDVLATAIDSTGDSTIVSFSIHATYLDLSLGGINAELYKTSENEVLFLTINLHTYQEDDQDEKLNMIADVIGKMDIDFIAFQECAQHKNATIIEANIRKDNMAWRIANMLKSNYNTDYGFGWDWAHYGWNVWEEGIAVVSKHPLVETDNRYISSNKSQTNIESRKVIYGAFQLGDKRIHLFSAHTHWRTSETSEEQNNQMKNIKAMVLEKEVANSYSFVAGDFNGNPTSSYPWSEGYNTMVKDGIFIDTYFVANPDANNKPAQSKHHTILGDFPGRIDYIFMKDNTAFEIQASQIIFKTDVVGKVSDHYGVLTKVRLE